MRETERGRERERGRGRERDLLIHSVDRLDDHLWRCGERGAQRGDRAPTTPSPPVKHEYPTAKGGCQDGRDGDGDHARVSTEGAGLRACGGPSTGQQAGVFYVETGESRRRGR